MLASLLLASVEGVASTGDESWALASSHRSTRLLSELESSGRSQVLLVAPAVSVTLSASSNAS